MPSLALVGPSWPLRGGIARTTTALAAALASRTSLACFLVPTRQYPRWLYPGSQDVDPQACPRLAQAEACYGTLEPWTWGGLLRRLRHHRPELVVVPYWTWAWAPVDLAVACSAIAPVMAIAHNPADHDASWLARRLARLTLRKCSGFLCHAHTVERALAVRHPDVPVAVHPLPPVASPAFDRDTARARLGVPAGAVALLCFGLIRPYKGVDVLLEAMARLPDGSPIVLLLAGEPWGELGGVLRHRLAAPDLQGRVRARLAWVPEEEATCWFAAADAAVLPYRAATGSAVAAQAIGWGLPIVGSRVGGIGEAVEDEVNGLLVPPEEVDALVTALRRMEDAGLRERLAAGARVAARRWTWDTYAATLEDLAREVLASAREGSATPSVPA